MHWGWVQAGEAGFQDAKSLAGRLGQRFRDCGVAHRVALSHSGKAVGFAGLSQFYRLDAGGSPSLVLGGLEHLSTIC